MEKQRFDVCACSVTKSYLVFCIIVDYSPPGCSVHGTLQARILEWVAIFSSGDLPDPGIKPLSSAPPALAGQLFTTEPPGKIERFDKQIFSGPCRDSGRQNGL